MENQDELSESSDLEKVCVVEGQKDNLDIIPRNNFGLNGVNILEFRTGMSYPFLFVIPIGVSNIQKCYSVTNT